MSTSTEWSATIARLPSTSMGEHQDGLGAVQDFLVRFGYLPEGDFDRDSLDAATSKALATYQEMGGHGVTGDFDNTTREEMLAPRCAMPDARRGIAFTATCAWDRFRLTYAFDTGTGDTVGEFAAVRKAFNTWSEVVPLTFVEVGMDDRPDIVVDWRPAADPDYNMVGTTLAHADYPPGCSSTALPKPLHFDDEEHNWVVGPVSGSFDIETVALHEIGHLIGLAHSTLPSAVMYRSVGSNKTKRDLTSDDITGVRSLYGPATGLLDGVYRLNQRSSGRFLDAHETSSVDFRAVTRTRQSDDTQRWCITPVGAVYLIQQRSSRRFLDAHETPAADYSVVTRNAQDDETQVWVILGDAGSVPSIGTIQQLSNGRYVDAHEVASRDFNVVTRPLHNNDQQRFTFTRSLGGSFTIRQVSSGRFVDAHEVASHDFTVVTRPSQNDNTQRWILTRIGGVYTVQQLSSRRFLDAHQVATRDFSVVTRPRHPANPAQLWAMLPVGDNSHTIQQVSNGRFIDAYEAASHDFDAVTRPRHNNEQQRWRIAPA